MKAAHPKSARAAGEARRSMRLEAAAIAIACGIAGCRAVLGLDEPTLDPCASGCVDGEVLDATLAADGALASDSGLDAGELPENDGAQLSDGGEADGSRADGASDAASDTGTVHGLQCGAPSNSTFCTADAPVCCRISGDASVSYTCVAGVAQCASDNEYAILCSGTSTCGSTQVCCHFNSSMKCETAKDCKSGGGDRVCDPNLPADCGDASTCSRLISALPYFACAP